MIRKWPISLVALMLAGCAVQAEQATVPALGKEALATQIGEKPGPASPPTGQQWLYGSAEATAASLQAYRAIAEFVSQKAAIRTEGQGIRQTVLSSGTTPDAPRFDSCGSKPLAAVFDADETLIWNVGAMRYMAEQGKDFDPLIWNEWEKTGAGKAIAMPGAIAALAAMRRAGVTIIANTNRTAANAAGTESALYAAGLGSFRHGETLFLMGDAPDGSSKDGRRAIIASRYCVIAMAGDQLGDFSQAFNAKAISVADRKALSTHPAIIDIWGNGWFMLPNPVYGPSIRGSFEEIFTPETKWTPPMENQK
ncbi:MAG: HAD family acid phosphatase [Sphingorhabdus sp.]